MLPGAAKFSFAGFHLYFIIPRRTPDVNIRQQRALRYSYNKINIIYFGIHLKKILFADGGACVFSTRFYPDSWENTGIFFGVDCAQERRLLNL
jgi:hypothetical protein